MIVNVENTKEIGENRVNQMHKNLDNFIQNSLNEFKFVEVRPELYDNVGNDINSIISHKSTIPDLVIWNKPFNKNECFYKNKDSTKYNKFPRVPFFIRLNNKNEKYKNRKNIHQSQIEKEGNNTYEELVDFVDKLNIRQNEENKDKEGKKANELNINKINNKIQNQETNMNINNSISANSASDISGIDKIYSNDRINKEEMNYLNEKEKGNNINIQPHYTQYITPVNKTKKTMNDYYQNQFKHNELLMNCVYAYLDKKGWIIFRNDGEYLSNFTSFELFTFLTNILKSKNDLKMYTIGMQMDSLLFNGEQIYIILSQTLPIILQKKKLEYEMMKKKKMNEDKKIMKVNREEKENISNNLLNKESERINGIFYKNVNNKDMSNEYNEYNNQIYQH